MPTVPWVEPQTNVSDAIQAERLHRALLWFIHFHDLFPATTDRYPEQVIAQVEARVAYAKSLMPQEFPTEKVVDRSKGGRPMHKKSGEPRAKPGRKPKEAGNGAQSTVVHRIADGDDTFR